MIEIPIEKLLYASWNYKKEESKIQDKIEKSILENGLIQNIVVREMDVGYEVINGNHRLKVLNNLGYETVTCFNVGKISLEKAKKICYTLNELKQNSDTALEFNLLNDFINLDFDTYFVEDHKINSIKRANDIKNRKDSIVSRKKSDNFEHIDLDKFKRDLSIDVMNPSTTKEISKKCPNCGYHL